MNSFTVTVEKDHISKLTHVTPLNAIAELIWNSLDAESTAIDLQIERSELGVQSVTLTDNGHGIAFNDAAKLFGTLGGSWKRGKKQTDNRHRLLHGREGQGRFRSFAIGSLVNWYSVYEQDGQKFAFTITGTLEEINRFYITDIEPVSADTPTGVRAKIENISRHSSLQDPEHIREKLTPLFALFLKSYETTVISVDNIPLNPADLISRQTNRSMKEIIYDKTVFPVSLEIVEWDQESVQDIFFCSEGGFPLAPCENHSIKVKGKHSFTVYLKSVFFEQLNSRGLLQIASMIPELDQVVKECTKKLKRHFATKENKEQDKEVLQWQDEKSYPYEGEAVSLWEKSERRIFDSIAHQIVQKLPELESASPKVRSFQFSMIKEIIEKSPESVSSIFGELFKINKDEQDKLSLQVKRFVRQRENDQ